MRAYSGKLAQWRGCLFIRNLILSSSYFACKSVDNKGGNQTGVSICTSGFLKGTHGSDETTSNRGEVIKFTTDLDGALSNPKVYLPNCLDHFDASQLPASCNCRFLHVILLLFLSIQNGAMERIGQNT